MQISTERFEDHGLQIRRQHHLSRNLTWRIFHNDLDVRRSCMLCAAAAGAHQVNVFRVVVIFAAVHSFFLA